MEEQELKRMHSEAPRRAGVGVLDANEKMWGGVWCAP